MRYWLTIEMIQLKQNCVQLVEISTIFENIQKENVFYCAIPTYGIEQKIKYSLQFYIQFLSLLRIQTNTVRILPVQKNIARKK